MKYKKRSTRVKRSQIEKPISERNMEAEVQAADSMVRLAKLSDDALAGDISELLVESGRTYVANGSNVDLAVHLAAYCAVASVVNVGKADSDELTIIRREELRYRVRANRLEEVVRNYDGHRDWVIGGVLMLPSDYWESEPSQRTQEIIGVRKKRVDNLDRETDLMKNDKHLAREQKLFENQKLSEILAEATGLLRGFYQKTGEEGRLIQYKRLRAVEYWVEMKQEIATP